MNTSRSKNYNLGRKSKGLGMMELLIYMAIVALLIFAILGMVNVAQAGRVAQAESQNFNMMMTDTRAKFATQGSFTGVTPAVLVNLGVARGTSVAGNTIMTGWNTTVGVQAINLFGNAADGVQFTYTMPRDVCSDFVTNASGGSARVTVGGTAVKDTTTGNNTVNVATLGTACEGGAGGNVTVALAQGR